MTFKRKKSVQKAKLCYNEAGLRQNFKPKSTNVRYWKLYIEEYIAATTICNG